MIWGWAILALAAAAACTSPNERICSAGERCTEASAPFCDLDGVLGPTRNTCVPTTCTSGEALTCVGDVAYSCNTLGDSYVRESCTRGCAADGMRCADIPRANGVGPAFAVAGGQPAVELVDGDVLDVATGEVSSSAGVRLRWMPTRLPARYPAPAIAVFVASSLLVRGRVQLVDGAANGTAVAFAVAGDVTISGSLLLVPSAVGGPPGSLDCDTPRGRVVGTWRVGGGGGGHATAGAASGGYTVTGEPGAQGGAAYATPTLDPLHGGCAGGTDPSVRAGTSWGGGAIQISSGGSIALGREALVDATGFVGLRDPVVPAGGGGAGGAILLEAPRVVIGARAVLSANGAGGKSGSGYPAIPSVGGAPSAGRGCLAFNCSAGGAGGHLSPPAASAALDNPVGEVATSGGGGGAAGYVRIVVVDGGYERAEDAVVSPVPTLGTLGAP